MCRGIVCPAVPLRTDFDFLDQLQQQQQERPQSIGMNSIETSNRVGASANALELLLHRIAQMAEVWWRSKFLFVTSLHSRFLFH